MSACICGNTFEQRDGKGRTRQHCSDACKQLDYRARKASKLRVTKLEDIRFYCGIGEKQWNHHPVTPGPYACISPVYGKTEKKQSVNAVYVPQGTSIIQDSGAFSDGPSLRLSVEEALERQIAHAEQFDYTHQITHRASYDLLIDEKWENGIRHKARWTEADAELAVKLTVKAAAFLSAHRQDIPCILSAQGVSAKQYLKCAEQVVPHLETQDLFGLGGWCVTGKFPAQIMPVFRETMHEVIPFLGREGVKHVHIWGVCYAPALGELLWLCNQHDIALSTDSMGPSIKPCMGAWGYASWRDNTYHQPSPDIRGLERARHVQLTREWLADFRIREAKHYRSVWREKPHQLSLLEAV